MPKENIELIAFNRGIISNLALARTDLRRTALSAEIQTNWMPRTLGSMMLRPGWQYYNSSRSNNYAVYIPFIFATSDTADIEMTENYMRVSVGNTVISRPSVSTAVGDGDFGSAVSWTDASDTGASATISGGEAQLMGSKFGAAILKQQVSVAGGDQNVEHALEITVTRGPVTLRVGSSDGDDDYISETNLGTGSHSLAFTPTGDFWIELFSYERYTTTLTNCTVAASGAMELPTPYAEADLTKIRYDQSADVIYLAAYGYQQRKIERRGTRSWSIVLYEPLDGPFRLLNVSRTTLTPSGINGNITLTASRSYFKSTNVGSLFQLTSTGQRVDESFTDENQESDVIRVTGVGAGQRTFSITRSGTFTGTITLQRSVSEPGSWVDVTTYTGAGTTNYNDGLDNQIVYYRLVVKSGDWTSGTAITEMFYEYGGITGVVRVTAFNSATDVDAIVLKSLGNTDDTTDWAEGRWSDRRGWPSSTAFFEGRKWWFGKGQVNASISDAYESFDPDQEGDSAPIDRSIASGPVDNIPWGLPLNRLMLGAEGGEHSVRSSSFDELVTAANFNLREPSTEGSAEVQAVKVNDRGMFVQRSGTKLMQLSITDSVSYDYASQDLMELAPELGQPSIVRIAVQRQPDTRVHCVRSDGKVVVLVDEPAENVLCWVLVETDGEVEDVWVLPGDIEDEVYYSVKRTVNGGTVRYKEKWAMESEARGGTLNKIADSFVTYTGSSTATITGLSHLEGEEVVAWGDGKDLGTYTVSGGQITLTEAVENCVVGLGYTAQFKSSKLAYAAGGGTALTQIKTFSGLGLILADVHYQGLEYGQSFDDLEPLPLIGDDDEEIAEHTVHENRDIELLPVEHEWLTDPRICLQAQAPRPCTVLCAVTDVNTNA